MKYYVYTDGACNQDANVMSSACFIRTRYNFIGLHAVPFKGNSPAVAESLALGVAAELLMSLCSLTDNDTVEIYTDSQSVIEFFKDFKDPNVRPRTNDVRVRIAWANLRKLNSLSCVTIGKIKAHKDSLNGNKVADRWAKSTLRKAVSKSKL